MSQGRADSKAANYRERAGLTLLEVELSRFPYLCISQTFITVPSLGAMARKCFYLCFTVS